MSGRQGTGAARGGAIALAWLALVAPGVDAESSVARAPAPTAGVGEDDEDARGPETTDLVVVRAEDGRPLVGARVTRDDGAALAATDREGRAALAPPPAGVTYLVAASGRVPESIDAARFAALTAGSGAALALEPAAHLEVVIYDARGGVLPGAEVVLRDDLVPTLGGPSLLDETAADAWTARTDQHGRCRFTELPASGTLRARVRYEGQVLREIEWAVRFEDRRSVRVGWIVDPGRDREGRAFDGADDPVAGARLWLVANDDDPFGRRASKLMGAVDDRPLRVVEADDAGRFTLADLPHGWYRVGAAPGSEWLAIGDPLEHDLRDEPRAFRVLLRAGVVLDGTVEASDGAPLADALVRVRVPGVEGALQTRADEDGRFRLRVPRDRPLRLEAVDERFGFATRPTHVPPGTSRVDLRFD